MRNMGLFPTLGSLQLEIIKTVAESPKLLVVNQIAKVLGKDQTTIFKSVQLLLNAEILHGERESDGIRKFLQLTDKGVCHAIVSCDIDYETILQNHDYLIPFAELPIIQSLVQGKELRKKVYAEIAFDAVMSDDFVDLTINGNMITKYAPPIKGRYLETDAEQMNLILGAISSSLEVSKGFEINRKELDSFIEKIKIAELKRLEGISKRLDKFDAMMKEKGNA